MKFSHRRRRPIVSLVVAFCCLGIAPAWPQAEQGGDAAGTDAARTGPGTADSDAGASELLDAFFAEVRDLSADFAQQRFAADGEPVENVSTGRFLLRRPDQFRWYYAPPEEQIIVADGEWLWLYDVEFEQVEQRPVSDLASSPALLLSGALPLRDHYRIVELAPADELRWIELTPIDPAGSEFTVARLGFRDRLPVVIELVDGLDELTRVAFSGVGINSGLTADDFAFVPPPGVTVIEAGN